MAIVFNNLSGGSGGKLYKHKVSISIESGGFWGYCTIYSYDSTPFTESTLIAYIKEKGNQECSNSYNLKDNAIRIIRDLRVSGNNLSIYIIKYTFDFANQTIVNDSTQLSGGISFRSDTVTEL